MNRKRHDVARDFSQPCRLTMRSISSLPDGALDQLQKLSSNPTNSIGVSARFVLMANTNSDLKEPIAHFP